MRDLNEDFADYERQIAELRRENERLRRLVMERLADEPKACPHCEKWKTCLVETERQRKRLELRVDELEDHCEDVEQAAMQANARADPPPPGVDLAEADCVSLRCQELASEASEEGRNKTTGVLNGAAETIDALVAALRRRAEPPRAAIHALAKFGAAVIEEARGELGDLDGGWLQDKAVECGVLEPVTAMASCGEECRCAEYDDFPQECFQYPEDIRAALSASNMSWRFR